MESSQLNYQSGENKMANIPLMLAGGIGGGLELVVGTKDYSQPHKSNTFWWVVLDLTNPTAAPLVNELSDSNSTVPSNVLAQTNEANRLLCFSLNNVFASNMPTGGLYSFLIKAGASTQLKRLEQIVEQSGSNYLDVASYNLVATLTSEDEPGFEGMDIHHDVIITCELMPIDCNGNTIYAPVQLS
jgi:hypothetical protein